MAQQNVALKLWGQEGEPHDCAVVWRNGRSFDQWQTSAFASDQPVRLSQRSDEGWIGRRCWFLTDGEVPLSATKQQREWQEVPDDLAGHVNDPLVRREPHGQVDRVLGGRSIISPSAESRTAST
jgi:hypothetical protein